MDDLKKNEYNRLCREIASYNDFSVRVINTCITFSSAIIAAGLAIKTDISSLVHSYIFLAVNIILIPSLHLLSSYLKAIFRIGMYIAVFHESEESGIKFENRLLKFDSETSLTKSRHGILTTFGSLFIVSLFFSAYYAITKPDFRFYSEWHYFFIVSLIIILAIHAMVKYKYSSPVVLKKKYKKKWENIKAKGQ